MSVKRDIEYYAEILKTANVIERSDPILCANLLGKCVALIENHEDEFLEFYPKRINDKKNLDSRLKSLIKRYGKELSGLKENLLATTSFTSFISESSERAKVLAGRFEYKKAIGVLDEGIKMAKNLSVSDLAEILSNQKKIITDERNDYNAKIKLIKTSVGKVKNLQKEEDLQSTIEESEKIISLAREIRRQDFVKKYEEFIEQAKEKITTLEQDTSILIKKVKKLEEEGDFVNASLKCDQIIANSEKLHDEDTKNEILTRKKNIESKKEALESDLDTKINIYIDQHNDNIQKKRYTEAIKNCDVIISTAQELKKTDIIQEYETKKSDDEKLLQTQVDELKKSQNDLEEKIEKSKSKKELLISIHLMNDLLEVLNELNDEEEFQKRFDEREKIKAQYAEEQKLQREHLKTLNAKVDEYLQENKTLQAIKACEECLDYSENQINDKSSIEYYEKQLVSLKEKYEKEQEFLDTQINQIKSDIDKHVESGDNDAIIENCNKLINLALKNDRMDLVDEYTAKKNEYSDKATQEEEQIKLEEYGLEKEKEDAEKRRLEEEARIKAEEEARLKAEEEARLKAVEESKPNPDYLIELNNKIEKYLNEYKVEEATNIAEEGVGWLKKQIKS